jgi:hypothetical protein
LFRRGVPLGRVVPVGVSMAGVPVVAARVAVQGYTRVGSGRAPCGE